MKNRMKTLIALAAVAGGAITFVLNLEHIFPPKASGAFRDVPEWRDSYIVALQKKYGKPLYSQDDEETFIRDFFQDRKGGVFVDVGSADYKHFSTTYYLEKYLGWTGVAVDANDEYRRGYELHRPGTRFFAFFVSDTSDALADYYFVPESKYTASGDKEFAEYWGKAQKKKVKTITLNKLLSQQRVETIDLLSMDVENWEPQILAGFDIEKYAPKLVCIEFNGKTEPKIRAYFARHNYVEIPRYSRVDVLNRYYMPKGILNVRPELANEPS